jgi:uncharacterized protein YkwD
MLHRYGADRQSTPGDPRPMGCRATRLALALILGVAACTPMRISRAQAPLGYWLYLPLVQRAEVAPPAYSAEQQTMSDAINDARAARGLARLDLVPEVFRAAQIHSEFMAGTACFSHQCPGELPLGERLTAAGYAWSSCGEMIGSAPYATVATMVAAWLASDGHRAILLSTEFTDLGVGYALATNGASYWTVDVGVPAP